MGALSDLLKRPSPAATPATPATQPSADVRAVVVSQVSQESQGGEPEIRAHLLTLADDELLPAATVHRLGAGDVAACAGLPDDTLRACLRALDRGHGMDAGQCPPDYTQAIHCDGCGPVWLWRGAPARLAACPWCFRRKAGKAISRPPVKCGDCRRYLPDPVSPAAGMGGCALGAGRAYWPMKAHRCADIRPALADLTHAISFASNRNDATRSRHRQLHLPRCSHDQRHFHRIVPLRSACNIAHTSSTKPRP